MTSRDKVGCPPVALPLDRVLAARAANAEQLGKQWEAAVRSRCGKAEAAGGEAEGKRQANRDAHAAVLRYLRALGGVLSTGLTHLAVTPLDLVKCNMQVDPSKYRDISTAFGVMLQEQGLGGFFKGWMATLVGYSCQGACKFGFYEFFRKCYSDIAGPDNAAKLKTLIYLAASASAEVIADVALCPMEAVKVRVQTQPGFARGLIDGLPKIVQSEGFTKGCFLFGAAKFPTIVEMVYKHAVPKPKDQCGKPLQLAVSFAGGYIAGVFCAAISHPADNLVSFLNNAQGATVADAVRTLGMWGLFTRGLPLRIIMVGTLTGAQWATYDAFKVFVGLPTSGGVNPSWKSAATLHRMGHEKQN
ncbi:hypothetical protein PR202_gb19317 [Eleusine coracana subsp. coracana]|uniref:Uncharacterized protein n=1 Tax=Eleusine coracana subsp. coracana TaxID=191504 RepID=A0AAV5F8I9_ELECO|nr:hypothetical protein PR202_gb19317 [Eleusine coracana subsp. coracana]